MEGVGINLLQVQKVFKKYGSLIALNEIDFEIKSGICFGLIGPNGAGKSTLMKILSGILNDFDGEILMNGISLRNNISSIKGTLGYVPQDITLEETLTAVENLKFFGSLYGLKGKDLDDRAEEILRFVGLYERKNDFVRTFSGGMKRRINIGCALMHHPKLIIMDEPTVGVDPQSRKYIFDIIKSLKEQGTTIIYSSHYMEEVENLCDEIVLVDHGAVVEHGTVDEIISKHATPSVYVEFVEADEEDLMPFGELQPKGSGYLIKGEQPIEIIDSLTNFAKEKNLKVIRLEISKLTLEDIFISLTGSILRD